MKFWFALVAAVLTGTLAHSQNMPAQRPPMGWNSWNHFGGKVTDADIRSAADALVSTGMRDAGYVYVNVDDTWQGQRDANGVIHPNERFPDMKALGDYIHSKGLKFGIYSSPGPKTCARFEGSMAHEEQDAKTYAAWGVDFLKYDLCTFQDVMKAEPDPLLRKKLMVDAYTKMGAALRATGRPILYSLCQYGFDDVWDWGPQVGASMWRTTDDIKDRYERMFIIGNSEAELARYAAPGHWNDPDMLEIGNGKMTEEEYRTHMSLWALLAAPLLAGNDLTKMSPADREILMNKDVIAIDQDALGKQAVRVYQRGEFSVWTKQLSGGRTAVGLFNSSWTNFAPAVDLGKIAVEHGGHIHDVWMHEDLGVSHGELSLPVKSHGVRLLIIDPQ
ncbi:glycoside hydrolase family 27 protein [Granulicella cerasi]|uniref:Alpha-galactosidase n=2 Tax=Granulicella cerasi TaxID=741063 RepID=A0ABW1ZAN7_9BACT|nr:glycoside hydrolase family 27 protein [Granulicella cerasi]